MGRARRPGGCPTPCCHRRLENLVQIHGRSLPSPLGDRDAYQPAAARANTKPLLIHRHRPRQPSPLRRPGGNLHSLPTGINGTARKIFPNGLEYLARLSRPLGCHWQLVASANLVRFSHWQASCQCHPLAPPGLEYLGTLGRPHRPRIPALFRFQNTILTQSQPESHPRHTPAADGSINVFPMPFSRRKPRGHPGSSMKLAIAPSGSVTSIWAAAPARPATCAAPAQTPAPAANFSWWATSSIWS